MFALLNRDINSAARRILGYHSHFLLPYCSSATS